MTLAWAELGVREGAGKTNNPRVVDYYKDAGHKEVKEDETPWCAAYVGAMLYRASIQPNGSLGARSYERWGIKLRNPVYGCIGVKTRARGPLWAGHVGFVVAANRQQVWLLAGNQGDAVSVAAYPRELFTAWVWPSEFPVESGPLPMAYYQPALTNASEA